MRFMKLTEQDLINFIRNRVSEDKYLEFKSAISIDGNDKYEFCRDVAAFANTEGGRIIYGIKEEKGLAIEICKIPDHIDILKTRISQILESTLEPKLQNYELYQVSGCLIVDIRKSWNAPHAVKLDGTLCKFQFPYRTDSGRQFYDIHTLKEKIMEYSDLITDIKSFIEERVNIFRIENDNIFGKEDQIFVLVHMIPISTFYNHNSIDIDSLNSLPKSTLYDLLRPFKLDNTITNFLSSPNLEGLRVYWNIPDLLYYNQIFRNATIEACYEVNISNVPNKKIRYFHGNKFQTDMLADIKRVLDFLKSVGINEPTIISMNMFNINNCNLRDINLDEDSMPNALTKKHLNIGNIEIKLDEKIENSLEPLFKIIYNAFGCTKPK